MNTNWTRKRQAGGHLIIDDIGKVVAESVMDGESRHIVHCVNNYDRLVEALREVCDMWSTVSGANGWDADHLVQYETARALIAQLDTKGEE